MFGYVNINRGELKVKELEQYQSYYCGLCKKLKESYGFLGQLTLSYDMTFLVILLSSLYEEKEQQKKSFCMIHPTKKRAVLTTDFTEYGADMTVLLTYYKFLDNWQDEKNLLGWSGAKVLKKSCRKLEKKYPRQCREVRKAMEDLASAEKEQVQNLDQVAGYTGAMLKALFVPREDVWQEQLEAMGMAMGKFIYVMDAYEDLEKDRKRGSYNPLKALQNREDYESYCEQLLRLLMTDAAKAFEKLPILENGELLRNIIYAGVWTKYDSLRKKKAEESIKHGSV